MLTDPVCGKRIKRNRAHIAVDYEGITYYLCCPLCQTQFEREPQKFARPAYGEKAHAPQPHRGKVDRHEQHTHIARS
jgi:YHS domain-containing protein